jgi:hypothetical protein
MVTSLWNRACGGRGAMLDLNDDVERGGGVDLQAESEGVMPRASACMQAQSMKTRN